MDKSVSIRQPNEEQKMAIDHSGGVILSAGAGSGKTFVLVEHLVHLFKTSVNENKLNDEKAIRKFLSHIVVMTFTNKAAAELKQRLEKRIKLQIEIESEVSRLAWINILANLTALNIGTIHSFCLKLLSHGYFTQFPAQFKIASKIEFNDAIESLYDQWLGQNIKTLSVDVQEILLAQNEKVINSLKTIFSSPELRLQWNQNDSIEMVSAQSIEEVLTLIVKELNLNDLFFSELKIRDFNLSDYSEHQDKTWYQLVYQTDQIAFSHNLSLLEKFFKFEDFFANIKSIIKPRGKGDFSSINNWIDKIKDLRDFLKDYLDDLNAFVENKDLIKAWMQVLKSAFLYVEENYKTKNVVTFSDLEYYTLLGLKDEISRKRILNDFKYIIIDEFQDTSLIQFQIVEQVIGNDFSRLFCVGDVKQAIYGFRGGELAVYQAAIDRMPLSMKLLTNYRSRHEIVSFNNDLFFNLFKMGINFIGQDKLAVSYDHQLSPNVIDCKREKNEYINCTVISFKTSDESRARTSVSLLDRIEAIGIYNKIKLLVAKDEDDICVLYKKLAPSKYLIPMLHKTGIPFVAQVKVGLDADPIINIFKIILEQYKEQQNILHNQPSGDVLGSTQTILGCYLEYLGLSAESLGRSILSFNQDIPVWGIEQAFNKFLFSRSIHNSNYGNNLSLISSVCKIGGNSVDKVLSTLKKNRKDAYSMDFFVGNKNSKVKIMTAHASKGLEFKHVILGGIHTNGRSERDRSSLGTLPGSFSWSPKGSRKKSHQSPTAILEKIIAEKKNFSESKRLFYVANTRAQVSLNWFDIQIDNKPQAYSQDSWIKGIRLYQELIKDPVSSVNTETLEFKDGYGDSVAKDISHDTPQIPLFHVDNMGIVSAIDYRGNNQSSLTYFSELSVTRLVSLKQCPRKFYLQNVCQLSNDEIEEIFKTSNASEQVHNVGKPLTGFSSMDRGTILHKTLSSTFSKLVSGDHFSDVSMDEPRDLRAIQFALDKLTPYIQDYGFISERELKFQLYGHMIVGIPDLVLLPKNTLKHNKVKIWDFKTGQRKMDVEENYFFQLECYTVALYQKNKLNITDEIELTLAYLDQEEIITKTIFFDQAIKNLNSIWSKMADLSVINQDHCPKCLYKNLCHFK